MLGKEPQNDDPNLPSEWTRQVVERKTGQTAGRYVYILSPNKERRFRSKPDLERYLRTLDESHDINSFDFSVCGQTNKTNCAQKSVNHSKKSARRKMPKLPFKMRFGKKRGSQSAVEKMELQNKSKQATPTPGKSPSKRGRPAKKTPAADIRPSSGPSKITQKEMKSPVKSPAKQHRPTRKTNEIIKPVAPAPVDDRPKDLFTPKVLPAKRGRIPKKTFSPESDTPRSRNRPSKSDSSQAVLDDKPARGTQAKNKQVAIDNENDATSQPKKRGRARKTDLAEIESDLAAIKAAASGRSSSKKKKDGSLKKGRGNQKSLNEEQSPSPVRGKGKQSASRRGRGRPSKREASPEKIEEELADDDLLELQLEIDDEEIENVEEDGEVLSDLELDDVVPRKLSAKRQQSKSISKKRKGKSRQRAALYFFDNDYNQQQQDEEDVGLDEEECNEEFVPDLMVSNPVKGRPTDIGELELPFSDNMSAGSSSALSKRRRSEAAASYASAKRRRALDRRHEEQLALSMAAENSSLASVAGRAGAMPLFQSPAGLDLLRHAALVGVKGRKRQYDPATAYYDHNYGRPYDESPEALQNRILEAERERLRRQEADAAAAVQDQVNSVARAQNQMVQVMDEEVIVQTSESDNEDMTATTNIPSDSSSKPDTIENGNVEPMRTIKVPTEDGQHILVHAPMGAESINPQLLQQIILEATGAGNNGGLVSGEDGQQFVLETSDGERNEVTVESEDGDERYAIQVPQDVVIMNEQLLV